MQTVYYAIYRYIYNMCTIYNVCTPWTVCEIFEQFIQFNECVLGSARRRTTDYCRCFGVIDQYEYEL